MLNQQGEGMEKQIISKIVALIKEVGAVPKASENKFHGYKYRSHEDIVNKLQPALAKAGLVIIPTSKKIIQSDPGYVLMEVTYTITDGEQSIQFVGIGEGADKSKEGKAGDKSAYKAQTGAMKYALNDLLMLAGEDPEADTATHKDGKEKYNAFAAEVENQAKDPLQVPGNTDMRTQMIDMMKEMGWTDKRIEIKLKGADSIGNKEMLDKISIEYELFVNWKAKNPDKLSPGANASAPHKVGHTQDEDIPL